MSTPKGGAFGNVASYNQYRGFAVDQLVSRTTFEANQVVGNGDNGFAVDRSDDNRFVRNRVSANSNAGILLGGRGNRVNHNQIYGNGIGIELADADESVIALNDIAGNNEGIPLHSDSDRNLIRDNEVRSNSGTGVSVTDGSQWNRIEGNVSSFNGDTGFLVGSSHNTLLANRAMSNSRYGVHVSGGPGTSWRSTPPATTGSSTPSRTRMSRGTFGSRTASARATSRLARSCVAGDGLAGVDSGEAVHASNKAASAEAVIPHSRPRALSDASGQDVAAAHHRGATLMSPSWHGQTHVAT